MSPTTTTALSQRPGRQAVAAWASPATADLRRSLQAQRDAQIARLAAIDATAYLAHRLAGDEHLVIGQLEGIRRIIVDLEHALQRIDDGTYGTCETCSRVIPPARLEIRPYARYCVGCQEVHESRAA